MRFLCGYVEIPKDHKFYGVDDNTDFFVHGGITWYDKYLPYTKKRDSGKWILGFDCGHAGDYVYMPNSELFPMVGSIYRTMEYVENEIKQLVDQIDN